MAQMEEMARMVDEETRAALCVAIKRAMAKRGVTQKEIALAIGLSPTTISTYTTGKKVPKHVVAVRMADFLNWPEVVTLSTKLHSHGCEICGRTTLDAGQQYKKKYCGRACRSTAHTRKQRARRTGVSHERDRYVRRRLSVFQESIDRYCHDCTAGERLCRDETCSLREVSPLPFVQYERKKRSA
jgi:DNA-binding XRE family transcriptional regulator